MSCGVKVNISICQGKTFSKVFRWAQSRKTYKTISAATAAAPCVITAAGHGLPEGWAYQIEGATGMTELNTSAGVYRTAIVLTSDTLEINDLNARGLGPYTANSGVLIYPTPVDLTGYTARMHIREAVDDATAVLTLVSPTGIVIDNTDKTITVQISATATAALTISEGVYDLEMVSTDNVVSLLAYGKVTVGQEVTR